jgi:hypothetical protein
MFDARDLMVPDTRNRGTSVQQAALANSDELLDRRSRGQIRHLPGSDQLDAARFAIIGK